MLSKRQQHIVTYLMQQHSPITIEHLSRVCGCSYKTMFLELQKIQSLANTYDCYLHKKPSVGVFIKDKDNSCWQKMIEHVHYYEPMYRQRFILLSLLIHKTTQPKDVAQALQVSRQTVTRDLQVIKRSLLNGKLHQSTSGCHLMMDECELRRTLKNNWMTHSFIDVVFQSDDERLTQALKQATKEFNDYQTHLNVEFEDSSHKLLVVLSALLLIRSQFAQANDCDLSWHERQLIEPLSLDLDICALKLMAQSIAGTRLYKGSLMSNRLNQDLAYELLESLCHILQVSIDLSEPTINGLLLHLQATISRAKNQQIIENPLLEDVRVTSGLLYELVSQEIKKFSIKHDLEFSEHEIAYVVMHVSLLLQSQHQLQTPIKIAIVCQFGVATSKLLLAKIHALLPNHNLSGPFSISEFQTLKNNDLFDYVITTSPLSVANELVVSPILTSQDIALIETTIWNTTYWKQCDSLINTYRLHQQQQLSLSSLIKKRHITYTNNDLTYKEAIAYAAKGLLKDNIIEQSYIDKMIWAVETLGPYMVILPQVAFVHAAYDDGVNKNGISLLRLSQAIDFGERNAVQVKAIFVIASKVKEDMGLLKLVKILEANNNLQTLLNSEDSHEIVEMRG